MLCKWRTSLSTEVGDHMHLKIERHGESGLRVLEHDIPYLLFAHPSHFHTAAVFTLTGKPLMTSLES